MDVAQASTSGQASSIHPEWRVSKGTLTRMLLLWAAFVVLCTIGMVDSPVMYANVPVIGHINYYEALILGTALLGTGTLLRVAGDARPSGARRMCRLVIAYFVVELLLVLPLAIWLDKTTVLTVIKTMVGRFTWLLLPVILALCSDPRARRAAGIVVVIASVCLAAWGLFSAATGGGGYYIDDGELRWRVLALGGGGLLLFAWPFVLALSRLAPRRFTAGLIGVSLVGLVLTNSRSGLIAFALAGIACVVMSGQVRRFVPWLVPAALAGAVVWLLWGQQAASNLSYTLTHLLDFAAGGGADRLMRWRLAWDFFVAHPFNDYVWSWRYYLVYLQNPYEPHNFILQVAVFEGVAGLVFYGSMLATALRGAWGWGRKDVVVRALTGYLIAYLVFCFANTNWYDRGSIPLLVASVAALVARVDHLRAGEARAPETGIPQPSQMDVGVNEAQRNG